MPVRFEHPEWLWVAAASLPMAWLGLRWFLTMSRVRRWSAVLARAFLLASLASLLAGAVSVRRTDRLAVVAVIDVSDSVRRFATGPDDTRPDILPAVRDFLADASARRGPDDLLGVVAFDRRALAIATPSRADPLTRPIDVRMGEGTDIEAALRYASAMIPADAAGRIVLFSDGNETAGSAASAAGELVARFAGTGGDRAGLPIDVVPLGYEVTREVMVESVDVPPTAEAESVIPVRIVLRAAGPAEGVLRLVRDGVELDINGDGPGAGRPLRLTPGRQVEVADIQLEPGRVHRFDAVWEPRAERSGETTRFAGDTRTENNTASGLTITPGQGEVLIVDGVNQASPNGGAAMLSRTLGAAGLRVSMVAPSAFPEDLVSLQAYDLIVLQDVPADELSQRAQQSLAAHVQELGAGLVMLGGHSSFAPGGWRGSPIEPLLPVDMEIPDEMVIPTAAVMIVLDASGSMGHSVMGSLANKQEIANESAALAVATLDKRDLVGVIAFANFSREVAPLAPNTDPGATAERIRGISPGGGTVIGPALERASQALVAIDAEIKHVILLSDGQSVDAESLPAMAEQLGLLGIRVTTISVGSSADGATMEQIAQRSGGKHYAVLNPNVLPRVFIKAIRIVRTPMVREGAFVPRILSTGSTLIEPLAETPGMPALGGLVLTQARKDPSITTAMVTGKGEPVLAHWQVGLGQVAAFTSDARSDAWASAWARWPGYAEFWTRLARALSRPTDAGPYELRLAPEGDDLILRLEAADEQGRPIDYLSAPASVYTEDGGVREVRLTQIAPGLYEARVRGVEPGQVVAVVKPRLGEEALPPAVGGTTIASGAEFRALRSNQGLLGRLADETGGRVLNLARPDLAGLFDRASVPARVTAAPIFLPLMLLTLALFVLDVATRRVAWDRFVSREFGVDLRKAAAEAARPRGEQAERTLAGLRGKGGPARSGGPVVSSPGAAPAGPLDDDAAQRLIVEARARRERDEAERLRKIRDAMLGQARPASPAEPPGAGEEPPPKDTGPGGLLAAKRRARERFEQGQDGAP
jgi:Ca-activated chloride channel family protein